MAQMVVLSEIYSGEAQMRTLYLSVSNESESPVNPSQLFSPCLCHIGLSTVKFSSPTLLMFKRMANSYPKVTS